MTWPVSFSEPTHEALVLVPSETALVQDLGPFRTGRGMETDILRGSALLCAAENGRPVVGRDGKVLFSFEGNAIDAVNLHRFYERCIAAGGRLASRAPSIAYGSARPEELRPVARFDLARYVFVEILDEDALEAWSGEAVSGYLPPASLRTPTVEKEDTAPLCNLPMRSLASGQAGIFVWLLMDGTILSKDKDGTGPLIAWRPGDEGLSKMLTRAGVSPAEVLIYA